MKIEFSQAVTLTGGATIARDDLETARALAPVVVAADGGADRCLALGVTPDLVIGDMDSLDAALPSDVRVMRVAEQDSTDFEKCLRHTEAPFYIGVGFLGGRLDHTLAALHGILGHAGAPVVLIGEEDVAFASPRAWQIDLPPETRLSLFPLRPCRAIASTGLRWPLDGMALEAGTAIGTSNETTGGRVLVSFEGPGCVTMLPKPFLAAVVDSLTS